ncbi:fibronectin type III domain-containing protein, partial [Bacillus cereus group sp. TH43LC]|uniref:fibronectin type III domain-containing protein n=1 Tax=Bacillus cereus group sp. TH43LC TaxID=3018037 RepID=UPI0022E286B0
IAETDVKEVFEVDNLKPKTEYGFGVVVVDENGNSSKLTSVKATTLAPVLNPPEGVQATVQNGGLIIAWDRINSQFLKGYNVYVDGKKVNDTLLTSNRLNLKGLENDKSYKIQVSAINVDDVEGKKSEVVTESPSEKAITIDYDEVKIPFSPLDLLTSSISLLALLGGFVLLSIAIIWFKPLKELIVKAARRERDKK